MTVADSCQSTRRFTHCTLTVNVRIISINTTGTTLEIDLRKGVKNSEVDASGGAVVWYETSDSQDLNSVTTVHQVVDFYRPQELAEPPSS